MAHAAGKVRGHIASVDVASKTMVIDHKKQGMVTLKWTDSTSIDGGAEALAAGQWVRNIMAEDGTIAKVRRFPEKDKQ